MEQHSGEQRKIISREDYQLLRRYAQQLREGPRRAPPLAEKLINALDQMQKAPSSMIPTTVIGIGSTVEYLDDVIASRRNSILASPWQPCLDSSHVPVLSPFGIELLGAREGDHLVWKTLLGGWRGATIVRVRQVPKAAA